MIPVPFEEKAVQETSFYIQEAMRFDSKWVLPYLFVLLFPLATAAQTDVADTIHALQSVEVVGVRQPQREVIEGQRLGGSELQRLNGGAVADALLYFGGAQLKDYGGVGGIKTIDIRSMGAQHVGIYYDGVELGNAQNGQIDLGQLSLDNVQEIALYNGQRSTLLQSASDFAHAGTVYIRTRQPQFANGKTSHLKTKLTGGSSGLLALSSHWEQRLSGRLSLALSLGWQCANGRYRFRYRRVTPDGQVAYDTTATRHNGDVRAERVEASLHGLLQRGFWTTKLYFYDTGRGIPGAIVNNVWRRGERQYDTNFFLQHRWQKEVSDRWTTQVLAKYAYYRTHYLDRDTTHLPVDNRYWQQEFYLSTANTLQLLPGWSVSGSYDLRWNKLRADSYHFAFPTRLTHYAAMATALRLGRVELQGSCTGVFVSDRVRRGTSAHLHAFMPALFVSFHPFSRPDFSLHGFAKRSFRMPTFNDLYYTEIGNALLQPEQTNQYDVGWQYDHATLGRFWRTMSIRVDGYYNTVHDKIVAYPKGQQFRWTMLNLGRVHIWGTDVLASASITPATGWSMTLRGQYTWQMARDVSSPSTPYYRHQVAYIPRHSGSITASVQWGAWGMDYSFIYAGKRWNAQENTKRNEMQPWYTHDMALRYEFRLRKGQGRASLEINNLLNQRYEVIQNYPMPGTNVRIGMEIIW